LGHGRADSSGSYGNDTGGGGEGAGPVDVGLDGDIGRGHEGGKGREGEIYKVKGAAKSRVLIAHININIIPTR